MNGAPQSPLNLAPPQTLNVRQLFPLEAAVFLPLNSAPPAPLNVVQMSPLNFQIFSYTTTTIYVEPLPPLKVEPLYEY